VADSSMSTIRSKILLEESSDQIEDKILRALRPEVNKYLKRVFDSIKPQIINIVTNAIVNSPEYNSLLSGDLKYEFGLPDSSSRLGTILQFWKKINAEYKTISVQRKKLVGGFVINMIDKSYSDVLNLSVSSFITEKGSILNWLEWLLLFGNKTIIKDYTVEIGPNPRSRTGQAIMKGIQKSKWSVPSQFSGTPNDNWITRAIDSATPEINKLFNQALK
jgi:hypothetical protein